MKRVFALLCAVLALAGCSAPAAPRSTDRPMNTAIPTSVPPTHTPSHTPTPAAMAAPTKVPTKAPPTTQPTRSSPGRAPLEAANHQSYVDEGWFHIVGEIRNNSDQIMSRVKVFATLYDSDGEVSGSCMAHSWMFRIPPGGRAPFGTATDEWAGTASYVLEVEGSPDVSLGNDLEVVSHNSYTDEGWYRILGEVRNNGNQPVEDVSVVITLYDSDGLVSAGDQQFVELDVVPSGGLAPFEASIYQWTETERYELQAVGGFSGELRQDLEILSHEHAVDGDWLIVSGTVRNNGQSPAKEINIVVTFYDAAGQVIGVDSDYTDPEQVPAGGTASFEVLADYWPSFDHYAIYVEGR